MQKIFTFFFAFVLFTASVSLGQVTLKSESFDATVTGPNPPAPGWVLSAAGQTLWSRRTNGVAPLASLTPHSGAGMASFRSTSTPLGTQQSLISPAFDLSSRATNSAGVRFWMFRDSTLLANVDSIDVFINTTADTLNATKIGTVVRNRHLNIPDTQNINRWTHYSFNFPASYTGSTNYVLIRGTCRGGVRIYIDDVEWDTYPNQCTGTPNVGNILLTTTKICGGSGSSNLSLSSPINGVAGITYQWASATSIGGPFVNFGTNSPTASTGNIAATTYYQCTVTCATSSLTYTTPIDSVVVVSTPNPTITATAAANPVCSNAGNTLITVTGALTYTWSPAFVTANANADSVYVAPLVSTNYTITGTDAHGCKGTGNVAMTVRAAPNATITSNVAGNTICAGSTVILTAPTGTGITYSWTDGHITRRDTVAPTVTTVYGVTVTNVNTGCSNTDTITIVVNTGNIPVVTISPTSATYCTGHPVMLVASGATTYSWSPATGLSSTSKDTVYATPFGNTTYTVTGSNGSCPASATVVVTVSQSPAKSAITFLAGKDTICNGTTVILRGNPFGNGYSYTWNNGVTTRNDTITPTVSGLYIVTVSNAAGCSVSDSVSIFVSSGSSPTLSVTPSSATSCSGAPVTLIVSATNTTSLSWTPNPSSLNATADTVVVNPTGPNNSTVNYVVTASNGACSASATVPVLIATKPTKQAISIVSGNDTVCAGTTVILRGNPTANGYTYSWSNGVIGRNDTINPTASALYIVTVSNAAGCSVNDSLAITVIPGNPPTLSVSPSAATSCSGAPVTLIATTSNTTSLTWSPNPFSTNATGDTIVVKPTGPNNSTVTYVATASNGACSTSVSIPVLISTNPAKQAISFVSGSANACAGSMVIMRGNPFGNGYSYTWNNGPITRNDTVYPTLGNSLYYVVVKNAAGCSVSDSVTLNVQPSPIVNITTNRSPDLCPGDTITFTATVVGGTTTNWTRNGFPIPGSANNLSYTTAQAGTYNLNANSSNGCVGTDTAVVVVLHQNPILTAMAMPNDTICTNAWLTLSATTQGANDSIYWNNGAVNNTAFPVTTSTNYTVNATSIYGCKATPVSIAITALPAPTHGVVVGYSTITFGTAYSYYASNPDPNVTIQWIVFGGTINAGQNTDTVNITWNQGPCSLVLVQTNSIGCSDSSEYFVAADGISQLNTIHFNLQPNPSEQKTQIMGVKVARYEVQDLSGRVLLAERNTNEVDGTSLPTGIYLVRIYDVQGRAVGIVKWVKE